MNVDNVKQEAVPIPDAASRALPILKHCFGDALCAVYLHGSAVTGGLRPSSDVDLLVVIDQPTTLAIRALLVAELPRISGRHPAKPEGPRPIELIVFQRTELLSAAYPTRSEFLYGEWLRDEYEAGAVPNPVSDPDFTLLLAQARAAATALIGPAPSELLPVISDADIRRAIGGALPGLLGNLQGDERNVLLTLARMLQTLTTREFVPKDVAAEWAMPRLPAETASLLALARDAYLGTATDDWRPRQRAVEHAANDLSARLTARLSAPSP